MFSRQTRKVRVFLALADFVLVWLAFELAYAIRSSLPLPRLFFILPDVKLLLIFFAGGAWILAGLHLKIYDQVLSGRSRRWLLRGIHQTALAWLAVVFFQFSRRMDLSRPFLLLFAFFATGFLALFRLSFAFAAPRLSRELAPKRFLYIAGTGPSALRLAQHISEASDFGLSLGGFLDERPGEIHLAGRRFQVHPLDELPALLRRDVIDELIFAMSADRLSAMENLFLLCDEEGVRTRVSAEFFPHVNSRVYLDRLGGLPLLTFAAAPHDEFRLVLKRAIDLALAAAALILLSPLLLASALLIRLTSRGRVRFRQERCGLNGRRFHCLKFRTMVEDAEEPLGELAHLNVKKTAFKIPNDPRVTPLGRWLRKFSIDELPQLWNVLRGEMSIVGPRPAIPSEVERYEPWQRRRLRMRPGLTCLWAIAGRDELDFDEWMRLDLAYIDRWSLSLDWSIILRTIPQVLSGKGAH